MIGFPIAILLSEVICWISTTLFESEALCWFKTRVEKLEGPAAQVSRGYKICPFILISERIVFKAIGLFGLDHMLRTCIIIKKMHLG